MHVHKKNIDILKLIKDFAWIIKEIVHNKINKKKGEKRAHQTPDFE